MRPALLIFIENDWSVFIKLPAAMYPHVTRAAGIPVVMDDLCRRFIRLCHERGEKFLFHPLIGGWNSFPQTVSSSWTWATLWYWHCYAWIPVRPCITGLNCISLAHLKCSFTAYYTVKAEKANFSRLRFRQSAYGPDCMECLCNERKYRVSKVRDLASKAVRCLLNTSCGRRKRQDVR